MERLTDRELAEFENEFFQKLIKSIRESIYKLDDERINDNKSNNENTSKNIDSKFVNDMIIRRYWFLERR